MATETKRIDDASIPLVTDLNGVTIPVMQGGVSKRLMGEQIIKSSDTLIASYTHSGNQVFDATSLDLTTGVFTKANHGYTSGYVFGVLNNDVDILNVVPTELVNSSPLYLVVIDADSFHISTTNGGPAITYPSAANTGVDVSKFHFERKNVYGISLTGLNQKRIRVTMHGKRGRAGWTYLIVNGALLQRFSSPDGRNWQFLHNEIFINLNEKTLYYSGINNFKQFGTYPNWYFSVANFAGIEKTNSDIINSFTIDYDFANGTTINIYKQ